MHLYTHYVRHDVLLALDVNEWRWTGRVHACMTSKKHITPLDRVLGNPSKGWVADALDGLVHEGIAEQSWETDPERLKQRSGRSYLVFRLTDKGLREKDKILEKMLQRSGNRRLVLEPTFG